MSKRRWSFLFLVALATAAAHAAGPEAQYTPPRTADGSPDLQGVWNFSSDVPLERPAGVAGRTQFTRAELEAQKGAKARALNTISRLVPVEDVGLGWMDYAARIENLRTSLVVYPDNGKVPPLQEGVRRVPGVEQIFAALSEAKTAPPPALLAALGSGKKNGVEDFGDSDRCLFSDGPPFTPELDNNFVQVIQARDHVVLRTDHDLRIVPLDGRPHLSATLRSWSGDSRGRWDGNTLVVETTNFNNRTQSFAGAGKSHDKVVTERFTRVSADALDYEATIVDPKTFQDKVVIAYPMAKVDARVYEAACHEGNYSMFNMLSGARAEEAAAATKP